MTLTKGEHFLGIEDLAVFDGSARFSEVYGVLGERHRGSGGFLLMEKGRISKYVKATEMAIPAVERAAGGGKDALESLGERPIAELVSEMVEFTVPVEPEVFGFESDSAPLQQGPDAVFRVTNRGQFVGWFLNHEELVMTTTPRTIFRCTNTTDPNAPHDNVGYGKGTCRECGYPFQNAAASP